MALNLRCECGYDDEFLNYRYDYVDTYLANRESDQQTIEEWTDIEGVQMFAAGEIFRPVDVPVAITGSEANAFEVDMTRPEWRTQLQTAVTQALVSAGLATPSDKVELENMRREPLGDNVDRRGLEQQGVFYTTVNGKRTVDMPKSVQAGLGCAIRTPLTHSPDKDEMLGTYISDLVVRTKELVIGALTPSSDMYDLNARLTGGAGLGAKPGVVDIKSQVADLIARDAGLCTADLKTFSGLLATYADPLALEAIKRGKLTERGIAEKIADHIVNEVIEQVRADNKEVEAFYQAQHLTRTGVKQNVGSIFSTDSTVGQTAAR